MKKITIPESEWKSSIYRTKEWEDSVEITYWEHDYMKKIYIIRYKEL